MTTAWLFNLDAERELAAYRTGAPPRGPGAPARRRMQEAVERLRRPVDEGGLLGPEDVVLGDDPGGRGGLPEGSRARAWCPTPQARESFAGRGLELAGPPVEVLIAANARETFAGLDPLPGAMVASSLTELREAVERPGLPRSGLGSSDRAAWVLRSSLCCAGGSRMIAEAWGGHVLRWGAAALLEGPVEIQPFVDVLDEYSLHGWIDEQGGVLCGAPLRWKSGSSGDGPGEVPALTEQGLGRLIECGAEVGSSLAGLGYFGPFGVDAFRWSGPDGAQTLQVATDINARLTFQFSRGAPGLLGGAFSS